MIRIDSRKNRYRWKTPAAANFILGGMGAGLFIVRWLTSFGTSGENLPVGADYFALISAVLVISGFAAVAMEAGRPMRSIYAFLNFSTAWMSREVVFGWMFVFSCTTYHFIRSGFLAPFAALCGVLFILSQAMVLYRSSAITSWHTHLLTALLFSADLCTGYGAALLLGLKSKPLLIWGASLLAMHMIFSAVYLRRIEFEAAGEGARRSGVFKKMRCADSVGIWIPLCLSLLLLVPFLSHITLASTVCGLLVISGIGCRIHRIVCKKIKMTQVTIDKPMPESIKN